MDPADPTVKHAGTVPVERELFVLHPVVVFVVVAVTCVLASRFAVHTMFVGASFASFWPVSAVAILAVLALRRWAYAGVFAGMAVVAFIWTMGINKPLDHVALVGVLMFALGATLETFIGAKLCQRFGRGVHLSATARDMAAFVVVPGVLAAFVGAAATVCASFVVWNLSWSVAPVVFLSRWLGATTCIALVSPLVLLLQSQPKERLERARLLTLPIVLVFAIVTSIHSLVEKNRRHTIQVEFERDTAAVREAIDSRLASHIDLLFAVRSMIDLRHGVTREAMNRFVAPLRARLPGIQAIEWAPRVRGEERAAYEERVRREAYPTFAITEKTADSTIIVAGHRAEYFPVQYIEPFEGNSKALGFDLGSQPNRRQALEQARDLGRHVATGRILLVQETKRQFGLLMMLPYYDPEIPENALVEDRRARLQGFVVGVFRIGDILTSALSGQSWSGMDIVVEDQIAPPDERMLCLLDSDTDHGRECRTEGVIRHLNFEVTKSIDIGERTLRIQLSPRERFVVERVSANIVLVQGLTAAIAFVIAAFFLVFSHRFTLAAGLAVRTEELERSNVSLEKAKKEAEVANETKSKFLAMVSHELRTPLSVILGYSVLVAEDIASGQSSEALEGIERIRLSGEHLAAVINDVLDMARIEAGRLEISPEVFDVRELVRELAQSFESLAKKQGLELIVEVDDAAGEMRADPMRVRQILYNLIGNGLKFTPQGKVTISVACDKALAGDEFVFRVADTGIGIAKDDQGKLFQPFVQVDSSMARKYSGTGLGLSIVRHCVIAMNGSIDFTSELGVGTTFTVRLPRYAELQNSKQADMQSQ